MAAKITIVNGRAYDHGQVQVKINGVHYPAVKEIKYSAKLERGKAKGTAPVTRWFTRGSYECDGSLVMYKTLDGGSLKLIRDLGAGYLEKELTITISFGVDDDAVSLDTIMGAQLGGTEGGTAEGTDPNTDTFPLVAKMILIDGKAPIKGVST